MSGNNRPTVQAECDEHPLFSLHQHDVREMQEFLTSQKQEYASVDEFVDVTITSPPYADQKDYGYDADLQIGFGDSYDEYLEELRTVFRQTYRATKDTGTLWVVANTVKRNGRTVQLPFDIADICENLPGRTRCAKCGSYLRLNRETAERECPDCGWTFDPRPESWVLQDIVIWDKVRARPWSAKGSMRNVFEYILCFSKGSEFVFDLDAIRLADPSQFKEWWVDYPHRYNPRGKLPDNIWQMVTPNQGAYGDGTLDHPAPFPAALVERIIRLTTAPDDVVFDPFGGTGTVLAQADVMDRRSLGFELNEDYVAAYPSVRKSLQESATSGTTLAANQRKLMDLLCGLREIRYARELVRVARKEHDNSTLADLGITTVLNLSRGLEESDPTLDRHYVESTYIVAMADETPISVQETLTDTLALVKEQDPCSTFGIESTVTVQSASEVEESLFQWTDTPLFLYTDDVNHQIADELSLDEWARRVQSQADWRRTYTHRQHPPILSNVGLEVHHPNDTSTAGDISHTVTRRYSDGHTITTTME